MRLFRAIIFKTFIFKLLNDMFCMWFFFCLGFFSPFACLPCLQHSICYCAMNSKMPWNCSGSTLLPFSSIVGEKVKLHIHLQNLKIQIKVVFFFGFFCFVFSRFTSRLTTWKFWLLLTFSWMHHYWYLPS